MSKITDPLLVPWNQVSESQILGQDMEYSYFTLNEYYLEVEKLVLKQLVPLRLLKNVPFRYLVPQEDLLPNESIRFFFVDRNWLDAMVDGALSVGRIGTRDFAYDERKYDSLMANLHELEIEYRKIPNWATNPEAYGEIETWDSLKTSATKDELPPKMVDTGGAIAGFLLRSRAVRDWPSMRVMAYKAPDNKKFNWDINDRILTIRQERISDTVLLCLFNGTPSHIRIEEPRECLQLGVDVGDGGTTDHTVILRDFSGKELSDYPDYDDVPGLDSHSVPLKKIESVIDLWTMHNNLKAVFDGFNMNVDDFPSPDELDSAWLSLQFMQFPYQQDFVPGDELGVE